MIETKFDRKQKVKIKPLGVEGRVLSIWQTESGLQYQVRYFDNAKAESVYFFEDELEAAE